MLVSLPKLAALVIPTLLRPLPPDVPLLSIVTSAYHLPLLLPTKPLPPLKFVTDAKEVVRLPLLNQPLLSDGSNVCKPFAKSLSLPLESLPKLFASSPLR